MASVDVWSHIARKAARARDSEDLRDLKRLNLSVRDFVEDDVLP
eukprot:CAMPEP_0119265632 /NCGR_PEP_ID=MMETSP1329-20130426/4394_1 /TAXON_ID=114041 /ORGANISM="Genus nov. species nov., Strain RCC1024" /LENGTH=43 /DNA_ID= /DNA_START= /DNA_END= /DNA_ORIENTATION=